MMEQKEIVTRPNIFEYENYRSFLADYFRYCKNKQPQFSYRYFSQKAGFSSPNFLKLVMDGKRNLSAISIQQFAKAFKFSHLESEFFEYLVFFNQSETESKKIEWAQKILRCKGLQKIHPLRQAEYSYYANWYYIPIREMILLKNFRDDPLWIANQFSPPLSIAEVEQAFNHLEELGMISRNKHGQRVQTQRSVSTGDEVSHSLVKKYHKDMIQRGAESIDGIGKLRREVSAVCIPISENKREEIKTKIQQFRKEIMAIADSDNEAEEVYQLNIQWFPLIGKGEVTS